MSYQMTETEARDRLERITNYNSYHRRAGQPHHCMHESALRKLLTDWGFDPDRAVGIGYVPPPSPFLAKHGHPQEGGF